MRSYYKGEKPYPTMEVRRRNKEDFEIDSVEYEVRNRQHEVLESGSGQAEDHYIFFLLDTTKDHYMPGQIYYIYFSVTFKEIPGKLRMDRIEFRILQ